LIISYVLTAMPVTCASCEAETPCSCIVVSSPSTVPPIRILVPDLDPTTVYEISSHASNCEGLSPASDAFSTDPALPDAPQILAVEHMEDRTTAMVTVFCQVAKGDLLVLFCIHGKCHSIKQPFVLHIGSCPITRHAVTVRPAGCVRCEAEGPCKCIFGFAGTQVSAVAIRGNVTMSSGDVVVVLLEGLDPRLNYIIFSKAENCAGTGN
jgi:hypothetical protein